jgi:uncharacterized protein
MESTFTHEYNNHKLACAFLDAGKKDIVIFCHGYRSSSTGPNRLFVDIARKLALESISSLRFDQYGSGNSEGDFYNSSFDDWLKSTEAIIRHYLAQGYRVALLGQSMGGSTVIGVSAKVPALTAVVAWVPDPNVEPFTPPESGEIEEGGEVVQATYWQEATDAQIATKLKIATPPMYIVQCSDDEYVSAENHQAVVDNAQSHHTVEMLEGYKHSSWTREQADKVVAKTIDFLVTQLRSS